MLLTFALGLNSCVPPPCATNAPQCCKSSLLRFGKGKPAHCTKRCTGLPLAGSLVRLLWKISIKQFCIKTQSNFPIFYEKGRGWILQHDWQVKCICTLIQKSDAQEIDISYYGITISIKMWLPNNVPSSLQPNAVTLECLTNVTLIVSPHDYFSFTRFQWNRVLNLSFQTDG